MKKLSMFIMTLFCCYVQIEALQANDLIDLLLASDVESKIKTVESIPVAGFGLSNYDMSSQIQRLQRAISSEEVVLNDSSVDALAIALKRGRYRVANAFIDLFLQENIDMASYQTDDKLHAIYPQGTSLSEIIDCRLKFHRNYLENNEPIYIYPRQKELLESAIESLITMQTEIYLTNIPAPSLDRCDEILSTRTAIDSFFEWINYK